MVQVITYTSYTRYIYIHIYNFYCRVHLQWTTVDLLSARNKLVILQVILSPESGGYKVTDNFAKNLKLNTHTATPEGTSWVLCVKCIFPCNTCVHEDTLTVIYLKSTYTPQISMLILNNILCKRTPCVDIQLLHVYIKNSQHRYPFNTYSYLCIIILHYNVYYKFTFYWGSLPAKSVSYKVTPPRGGQRIGDTFTKCRKK